MLLLKKLPYWFTIIAFLPFLFFCLVGFFLIEHPINFLKEVLDYAISIFVLYSIGFILCKGILRLIWFLLSALLMSVIAFIKIAFYFLFQSKITLSAFYIIFETNEKESYEFLKTYLDIYILFFILCFIAILITQFFYYIKLYRKKSVWIHLSLFRIKTIPLLLLLLIGIFVSAYIIDLKFKSYNVVYQSYDAYHSYLQTHELFASNLIKNTSNLFGNVTSEDIPQTYVVIIGESTSSQHMGLYNYNRNTNPLLKKKSEELFIFEDVISPHTHTISSLNKILTLSNYENPEALAYGTIMQLANEAGFKTYWISNQQPIGLNETLITAMSKACDEQVFINEENGQYGALDEELLPHITDKLNNTEKKKIIFIHLMGTHSVYKFRYSDSFAKFTDDPITKFPSKKSKEMINEYDNAVLYNDFIVNSIIDEVKKKNLNSYVIYFSDHGDEVYQELNLVGHSEYHSTKSMNQVPFILWTSPLFNNQNKLVDSLPQFVRRKYMLDDFIHSFADLSGINFKQFDPKRSIFNTDFKNRTRIIKQNIDYDNR